MAVHLVQPHQRHARSSDLQVLLCTTCLQTQLLTCIGLRAVPLMPAGTGARSLKQSSKQRMMPCNIRCVVSCSPANVAMPAIGTTDAGSFATMQEMALGPPPGPLRELKADYNAQRQQLEQENASLRAEVEHTRLLLAQPSGEMQTIAAVERQHSSGSRVQLAQGLSREHSPGKQVLSEDNARLKRELARLRDRSRGHSASKGAASGNAEDDTLGSQHMLKHNSVTWH